MNPARPTDRSRGIALIAVLLALTLLLLLALPFVIGMGAGLDIATNDCDQRTAEVASASARELLLGEAALGHPSLDPTRTYDNLAELPSALPLPDKFAALTEEGRVLLAGEVWDLQRRIDLRGVSPLVLSNLLGTTVHLAEDLAPDAATILLDDGGNLPDEGFVLVDWELIRYGRRQGNQLHELQRGVHGREAGFMFALPADHTVTQGALVHDWRCLLAACWPFDARGGRKRLLPFASPAELAEVARAGAGGFSRAELDLLQRHTCTGGGSVTAAEWGRAERVFGTVAPPDGRVLRVRSALHLGPGATVRLRNLKTGATEFNLVLTAGTPRGVRDVVLATEFELGLLLPVTQEFPAIDTVVEPLLPVPVNVNTAAAEVVTALCRGIRRAQDVRTHDADGARRQRPPAPISGTEAEQFANDVVALRGDSAAQPTPFTGFEDFAERLFKPRFEAAQDFGQKNRWILVYRALQNPRDSVLELATGPICFDSGPWVGYRAAASVSRSTLAPATAARQERSGLAVAVPNLPLEESFDSQELLEECFRQDQRSPYWITWPVNTGALDPSQPGNDPAPRYVANVLAMAAPDLGLGQPRFASKDTADSGFLPACASTPPGAWRGEFQATETFALAIDPRGRDLTREGAYRMRNIGPREKGAQPTVQRSHDRISYPFSGQGGFATRFAAQFWAAPENWGPQVLFDHGTQDRNRNRITLEVKDAALLFEVLDEAGIDPEPDLVPTQPKRTAVQWTLPLAELGAKERTPVHCNVSAYGSRPDELSVLIDGFPRGKRKYLTHLAAPIPVYDPQNQAPVVPGSGTDPRFLDVQVDSVEGFPAQGILRIGNELFEYTSLQGNAFRCVFRDSFGGRIARQAPREFRPDIPVDRNGKPTVDVSSLTNGATLDVAPEHKIGAEVELYGYSLPLYNDTVLMPRETQLIGGLGGFAVARGWVTNARPISVNRPPPQNGTRPIGVGLDENSTEDIELANPQLQAIGQNNGPPPTPDTRILEAFPQGGGYALLVQVLVDAAAEENSTTTGTSKMIGGLEVIQFTARQDKKLTGIRRNVRLPGNDAVIRREYYNGTARCFVTQWDRSMELHAQGQSGRGTWYGDVERCMLLVVPISLPVVDPTCLADPADTGNSEWLQLLPPGNDVDTEWVRYDLVQDRKHVVRANRAAWDRCRFQLTVQSNPLVVRIGQLGSTTQSTGGVAVGGWPAVATTAGYIGYVPKLESDFPAIQPARLGLGFRGDPRTGTSSHPQANSKVLPCHRMQLWWGNYGAFTGRPGRLDRVTLIAGSQGSGVSRPATEWHTVNWSFRRYESDVRPQNGGVIAEPLGPTPFQVVAFKDGVRNVFLGVPPDQQVQDVRQVDRMVKFPSGELPSAFAEDVMVGAAAGNLLPSTGIVDEVHVGPQFAADLLLDEECALAAQEFRVRPDLMVLPSGVIIGGTPAGAFPVQGGLVQIDEEILAYQSQADGTFRVASKGRGMLGTEPRLHERMARVKFLAHVPAAILSQPLQAQGDVLHVQAIGALPPGGGALLAGNEVLHYTWSRRSGDAWSLEMPRWFPADAGDGDTATARGLFRGRFGTAPQAVGAGEAVVLFPIRYWDRYVPRADDPEQGCFQITRSSGPAFFTGISWQQETTDATVGVGCLVRADRAQPFTSDPERTAGFWRVERQAGQDRPSPLGWQSSQLEARFYAVYRTGCLDTVTHRAHAYKTAPKVKDVRIQYEGETVVLGEKVTTR